VTEGSSAGTMRLLFPGDDGRQIKKKIKKKRKEKTRKRVVKM
jgi:hypothetical protein